MTTYRNPTKKQFELLLCLGNGSMLVSGIAGKSRRTWEALLRYGWVDADQTDPPNGIRLTEGGYFAIVRGVTEHGIPPINFRAGDADRGE